MARLTRVKQCPSCGHKHALRLRRKGWQRLLANSGLYRCARCQEDYLVLGCCPKTSRSETS